MDKQLDWVESVDMKNDDDRNSSNKHILEEVEEILVDIFSTIASGILSKQACNRKSTTITFQCTRNPVRSLVPK